MDAFIKLTTKDKQIVYFNTRHILGFMGHKHGSSITTMVPVETWGANQMIVVETPEEIYSKINALSR